MQHFKPSDYMVPGFVDKIILENKDKGQCSVDVADEEDIVMPTRMFLLNVVFWEPLMQFGIAPTFQEIFKIKSITNSSISVIQTKLYDVALNKLPNVYYMDIVKAFADNIDRLYNLIRRHMGNYMPSIDALGLAKLVNTPGVKEIVDTRIEDSEGTSIAEVKMKALATELLKKLRDPNTPNNCLYPYMQANTLKANQIPQVLIGYGTRSDIDDTMRKHIINESSNSGLRTVTDLATEYLSAKKAVYFSRSGIRTSQYFARKMRLACSMQSTIYPRSCGSEIVLPYVLPKNHMENYMYKVILDDKGNRIFLDNDNIKDYADKEVRLVSPLGCRHKDGICEYCAGYGKDRLIKYMPPGINIGLLSSSLTSSGVSQLILSTKHLIATLSMLYNLSDSASKYFYKDKDSIYWKKDVLKSMKGMYLRMPLDSLGLLSDLTLNTLPSAESFSQLPFIEVIKDNKVVDVIQLESEVFCPYMATSTLQYLRKIFDKIETDEDSLMFPVDGLDPKIEFMKYVIMNDDMVTYTERVISFLNKSITEYTDLSLALRDFTDIIYSKTNINVFFLEMILKSLLVTSEDDFTYPEITDIHHVCFSGIDKLINGQTFSAKMAFERLNDYLTAPKTYMLPRPVGEFGPFFGIV